MLGKGFRKLTITIIGVGCIMTGIFTHYISGDTGAWAIVSIVGASMGGYAGEYFGNKSVK